MPAISAAIGCPIPTSIHPYPNKDRQELGIPPASSLVLVLVDGLGFHNLSERRGHAPYMRSLISEPRSARPITTCFPSTTAVAMATVGTGTCPGLTAITAYTQVNPLTGGLSQMISFRNAPQPLEIQQEPTIFELLASKGVRVDSCGIAKFKNSALTQAALRGSKYHARVTMEERIEQTALLARKPGLTYLYIPDVDKAGHEYGLDSDQWVSEFEKTDTYIALLRRSLPSGTVLLVTADHGMINSNPRHRIDIAENPDLCQDVSLVGGEPRNVMLYVHGEDDVQKQEKVEKVADRYRSHLGESFRIYKKDQAINLGFYGLVGTRAYSVLGDLIVVAQDDFTLVDTRSQKEEATRLPSIHGGSSAREMEIPLLIDQA